MPTYFLKLLQDLKLHKLKDQKSRKSRFVMPLIDAKYFKAALKIHRKCIRPSWHWNSVSWVADLLLKQPHATFWSRAGKIHAGLREIDFAKHVKIRKFRRRRTYHLKTSKTQILSFFGCAKTLTLLLRIFFCLKYFRSRVC